MLLRFSPLARHAFVRLAEGGREVGDEVQAERVCHISSWQQSRQHSWTEPAQTWNNKELTFSQTDSNWSKRQTSGSYNTDSAVKQYPSIGTCDSLCDVIKQRHRKPTEEQQQEEENQDGPEGAERRRHLM